MDEQQTTGQWVKQHREALDLTQQALAVKVGCAPVTIHAIETGVRRPSRQMARRLAAALAVPSEEQPAIVARLRGGLGLSRAAPRMELTVLAVSAPSSHEATDPLVAAVAQLVRHPALRLITLTGNDEPRKTRVGVQVLANSAASFGGRVGFVRLLAATCTSLLPFPSGTGHELLPAQSSLPGSEGHPRLLVVEQVAGPVIGLVAEVLTRNRELTVLATSSGPLGIAGECTLDLSTP